MKSSRSELRVSCGCLLSRDVKLPSQSNVLLWAKTCVSSADGYVLLFFCTADMMMDFPGLTKGHTRDISFSNFLFCESYKEHNEVLTLNILHLLPYLLIILIHGTRS